MFETLQAQPADKILALMQMYKDDPRETKIDLGVGVYKDATGLTPVMRAVKAAEHQLWEAQTSKAYTGLAGDPAFGDAMVQMVLGDAVPRAQVAAAATPGGTGAIRQAFELIQMARPQARVFVSNPTWPNHLSILKYLGMEMVPYRYFDDETRGVDFDGMIADLKTAQKGDVVLLHGCCHNPTGANLNAAEWDAVIKVLQDTGATPMIDIAYQGFGDGLEEDAFGLRAFAAKGIELLVASSFSKNFGLYNQRVGAMTVVATAAEAAQNAMSHVKLCIRTNYSNPPAHGARLVATVLADSELRTIWEQDVTIMRDRINSMRRLFVETMAAKTDKADFSFVATQRGMFSFSGLSKEQVLEIREKHSVYIVGSGRISIAGITSSNIDPLCSALASVL